MAGWNVISDLVAHKPTLVRHDLWDEVRAAIGERMSAAREFWVGPGAPGMGGGLPPVVAPRDAIGKIAAYRAAANNLFQHGGNVSQYEYHAFALECDAGDAEDSWGPKRLCTEFWAAEAFSVDPWTAAGLAQAGWGHPDFPLLPWADLWTDFLAILDLANLIAINTVAGSMGTRHFQRGQCENGSVWADTRSAAWSSIPGGGGQDMYGNVGRYGLGQVGGGGFNAYVASCDYVQCLLDLSGLWNVRHLAAYEASPPGDPDCDPTRLVIYLFHMPVSVDDLACPCLVQLSGDSGATWETLGTLETVPATTAFKPEKFVSTDPDRWTANSILRVTYDGDKNADTPSWTAPVSPGVTEYLQRAAVQGWGCVFAEFDWDFHA
jgi:hypothetical protein